MVDADDTTSLQKQLATQRGALAILLRQVAAYSEAHAQPAQLSGIAEARAQIARLKTQLRAAGVMVDEQAGDVVKEANAPARPMNIYGDYVGGDNVVGDKVGGNKYETHHHYSQPRQIIDPTTAQAQLDRLPLDVVPAPAVLPTPHRMTLCTNPQFV